MKTQAEILEGLGNFYGTERYFRHSLRLVLTDGAQWLCESAEMFWFADIIDSVLATMPKIRAQSFLVAKLVIKDESAVFTLEDGNYKVLYKQEIPYTDCSLDQIEVFIEESGDGFKVMLLPMEH